MPTLGEYIREQRLGRGLSLGQLASRLDLTAAVVRSWERDHDLPDASALGRLADVLDVDVSDMSALTVGPGAPIAPSEEPVETVAEPAVTVTPVGPAPTGDGTVLDEDMVEVVDDPVAEDDAVGGEEELSPAALEPGEVHRESDEPSSTPDDVTTDLEGEPDGAPAEPSTTTSGGGPELDLETEPVAMADVMAEARRRAEADGIVAGGEVEGDEEMPEVEEPVRRRRPFLEYWRDPRQRLRYYLRWVGTAIAMAALAVGLVWAMGELLDALGQVTDQFGTQEPDELESLARWLTTRT